MSDSELTPVANAKFAGVLADEINRLMRQIKQLTAERDMLEEKYEIAVDMLSDTAQFYNRGRVYVTNQVDLRYNRRQERDNDVVWYT